MNIAYIGGGFVGTCSAAAAADFGHTVMVYDIDERKVRALSSGNHKEIESCLYEEGLAELIIRHKERLSFTTDKKKLSDFLDKAEAIFMCLPTPEIGDTGESDLTYYVAAAHEVADILRVRNNGTQEHYSVIVNKSTVPIEQLQVTEELFKAHEVKNVGFVSNPEFLVEGKAMVGSLHPDRVVVGASTENDFGIMREMYQQFYTSATVNYLEVSPKEAAAGKLLANFCLFNRLAVCFDVVGRTCETFSDISFEKVRHIITSDPRIGTWGFYDSLFAGGSCFIKDARSLAFQLKQKTVATSLVDEVYHANKRQLWNFLTRPERELGFSWAGKRVAVLGLAFKRDTNDIRNSPAIDIVTYAQAAQCKKITLCDPVANPIFERLFPASDSLEYVAKEEDAIAQADVILLTTDWPQYARLGDVLLAQLERPLIMDGRRMLQHRYDELCQKGYTILAVGSPLVRPENVAR